MRVRSVAMENFACYIKRAEVVLPETGLVLVTGPNGSGKSTIANAFSMGGWAKMIRGNYPWRRGTRGEVELHTDELTVRRIRTASDKPQLEIDGEACDTQQKGQPILDRLLGPYAVWRKTRIFKSRDADQFSGAGDADRKKLIEAILGNDRFDVALKGCRDTLRPLSDARSREAADLALCVSRLEGEGKRLLDAREVLAGLPATKPGESAADLRERLQERTKAVAALREEARKLARAGDAATAQATVASERLNRLDVDECPECGRPGIPAELLLRLRREVEVGRTTSKKEKAAALIRLEQLNKEGTDLDEDIRALQKKLATNEAEERQRRQTEEQRAKSQKIISGANETIDKLDSQIDALELKVRAKVHEISVLGACETVLGLRGVRAHILNATLASVERLTNRWLSAITDGAIAVRLVSTADAIALTVEGAGGGAYEDCSDGQARAIDISLMLGLGLVADLAHGQDPGSTVFDECFDILDVNATARACKVVRDLAKDRCVLLISHSDALERAVEPVAHLRVEAGRIWEV